jgi:membrane-bound metal-dependent hydrolase YbcI (DUF457 family)
MPNKYIHSVAGMAAGGSVAYAMAKSSTSEAQFQILLGGTCGGWAGSCIPDLVDPPTSYKHRGLGHNLILSACVGALAFHIANQLTSHGLLYDACNKEEGQPTTSFSQVLPSLLRGFAAGHISHLVLDSFTSMGIPV